MVRKSRLPGWFWMRGPRPDKTSCGVKREEGIRVGARLAEGEGDDKGTGVGSTKVGMGWAGFWGIVDGCRFLGFGFGFGVQWGLGCGCCFSVCDQGPAKSRPATHPRKTTTRSRHNPLREEDNWHQIRWVRRNGGLCVWQRTAKKSTRIANRCTQFHTGMGIVICCTSTLELASYVVAVFQRRQVKSSHKKRSRPRPGS